MIIETDLFEEDSRGETFEFVRKYFPNAEAWNYQEILSLRTGELEPTSLFRGSMSLAAKLGQQFKYANALNWMPEFKHHLLNRNYTFLDFESIVTWARINKICEHGGLFVRPVSPLKEFAGQAFHTQKKLETEFAFAVKNKNISPNTICVAAMGQKIREEARFVFVDNKLVDGCVYMQDDELVDKKILPISGATSLAADIGGGEYFTNIFNYVIDVAINETGEAKLIEINGFQTASFYHCDRDKIYAAWRNSLDADS